VNTELLLFACVVSVFFIALIIFVIFGQVTVRKLRKNPETKGELGIEFVSGWDILNVAGALAMPRWLNRKLRNTPLSYLYADADILEKHTNTLDRILAVLFYWMFISAILSILILTVLSHYDFFKL